jgi:hypothetical protein
VLPALTTSARRIQPARRVLLIAGAAVLASAAFTTGALAPPVAPMPAVSLADEIRPASWAMSLPQSWLAAPVPRLRLGDALDIFAVRQGDRAYSVPVAYAVSVVALDDKAIVLEVSQDDATAVLTAHGGGMLLVPLLRSTR